MDTGTKLSLCDNSVALYCYTRAVITPYTTIPYSGMPLGTFLYNECILTLAISKSVTFRVAFSDNYG